MEKYYKYKIEKLISVSKIITIHYFELTKDFVYPAESHDFWEMHYVDKGHVLCSSNGNITKLCQGELLFYKPMTEHQIIMDKDNSSNVCIVSFECNSITINAIQNTAYKLSQYEKTILSLLFEEANKTFELSKLNPSLKKLNQKKDSPIGSLQMIQNFLEQLLITLIRKEISNQEKSVLHSTTYGDPIVQSIANYLQDNVLTGFSLDLLSEKMGYGKTFLCTHFKNVTNKTILRFYNELQIEKAKSIIREFPEKTIEIVSDEMNFSTPAYFCSVFKKISGTSPKEYSRMIHAFDR